MESYPSIKQSIGAICITLGIMIVTAPLDLVMIPLIGNEAALFFTYIFSLGGSLYVIKRIRDKKSGSVALHFGIENKLLIPLTVITMFGINLGLIIPLVSLIPIPDSFKELFRSYGQPGVFLFMTVVIAAPVLEELLFRGIILHGFLKNYSHMKSIVISSLLFGLIHLNPWQFITAFIIGCFIGWVYFHTRSISLSIIIHAVNNFSAVVSMYYSGGILPAVSIIVIGIALTVAFCGLYWLKNIFDEQPPLEPAVDQRIITAEQEFTTQHDARDVLHDEP